MLTFIASAHLEHRGADAPSHNKEVVPALREAGDCSRQQSGETSQRAGRVGACSPRAVHALIAHPCVSAAVGRRHEHGGAAGGGVAHVQRAVGAAGGAGRELHAGAAGRAADRSRPR